MRPVVTPSPVVSLSRIPAKVDRTIDVTTSLYEREEETTAEFALVVRDDVRCHDTRRFMRMLIGNAK